MSDHRIIRTKRPNFAAIANHAAVDGKGVSDMKRLTHLVAAAAWLLLAPPATAGGGEPFEPIDAETLIEACRDMTYQKRLGTTVDMREGISQSVLCLEGHLLEQFKALWSSTVFPPESVADEVKRLRQVYGDLYWRLYNEHEGCTPCGTMYRTYDVGAEARLLEQILRDAVKQRNKYKLEQKRLPLTP